MARNLDIILNAVDNASGTINDVAGSITGLAGTVAKVGVGATAGMAAALGFLAERAADAVDESENLTDIQERFGEVLDSEQITRIREANAAFDDLRASALRLGAAVSERSSPALEGMADLATALIDRFAEFINEHNEAVIGFIGATVERVVVGFTVMETALANLGTSWELAKVSALSALVSMREEAEHFFTVAMPEWVEWLGDNWVNLLADGFGGALIVVGNFVTNAIEAMSELFDFIASGGRDSIDVDWTPLLEGFEAATAELPDIADRELTELEKVLRRRMDDLQGELAQDFVDRLERNRQIVGLGEDGGFETGNRDMPDLPSGDEEDRDGSGDGSSAPGRAGLVESRSLSGVALGDRMAMERSNAKANERTAQNTRDMIEEIRSMRDELEDMNRGLNREGRRLLS